MEIKEGGIMYQEAWELVDKLYGEYYLEMPPLIDDGGTLGYLMKKALARGCQRAKQTQAELRKKHKELKEKYDD